MRRRAGRLGRGTAALAAAAPLLCLALAAAPPATADEPHAAVGIGEDAASLLALSQRTAAEGDYDRAAAAGREAASAFRRLGDRRGESRSLNAVGQAELYRGDHALALGSFQQALALSRAAGDLEAEVEQLNNVGSAFFPQARYVEALRAYLEAQARVEQAVGAPWQARRRGLTLVNLAALYQRLGGYERALDLYQKFQEAPEVLGASEQARLLTNLGALYRRLGDPVKALETYAAAQRLFAREPHRYGEIGVLKNIGIVQALDLGRPAAALDTFSAALALAERERSDREAMTVRLYRGETLLRLGEVEEARTDLEAALAAAEALGTTEEQWKALYALGEVARAGGRADLAAARFRQAIAAIESVRSRLQVPALKTDFLADKRDVYDALVELLWQPSATAEVFQLLERSRARTFQDGLRERDRGGGAEPATLAGVQARLGPATLLLEYWATRAAAAVVWVTRDAAGVVRIPITPAELDGMSDFGRELVSGSGERWRPAARALGEKLLAGIEALRRPELRHLVVVPDGPLAALPFEVLELPGASGALVVERFDVAYLPSASVLLRQPPARRSWSFPWTRRLVAFGDPVPAAAGGASLAGALARDASLGRLPASAGEVRAIAELAGARAELHLGAGNLKAHLTGGRVRGVPLLHLSTHATADEVSPERSRIAFSPATPEDAVDYLFLREVYDLDLGGVELTTLSACDTERGKVIRGEGLQAFSRALLAAGSRATVTTLWRAADGPTAEFMKQLYFELGRRTPKAEALRMAKLRFLRSGGALGHPRFWAPFVLNGDGLGALPPAVSWSSLGAAAAALLAAALLAAALLVRRRPIATAAPSTSA